MKNTLLLFCFLLSSFALSAATITWNGQGGDEYWANGNNWDTGQVPIAGDIAIIPNGVELVLIYHDYIEVSRLIVGEKATLVVDEQSTLVAHQSNSTGITIGRNAAFINYGEVMVYYHSSQGINNEGGVFNYGQMSIKSVNHVGFDVEQRGGLVNYENAQLSIEDSRGTGLRCWGGVENQGAIQFISGNASPLIIQGIFENRAGASIITEPDYVIGINVSGMLINEGDIVSAGSSNGTCIDVYNNGFLENKRTGDITVDLQDRLSYSGIRITQGANLRNTGSIEVNSAGRSLYQYGLRIESGGRVINRQRANIDLNNFYQGIYLRSTAAILKNYGTYNITNADFPMWCEADVYNSGTVNAEGRIQIGPGVVWTNGGGELLINNGATTALFVTGDLENKNCGRVRVDGQLRVMGAGQMVNSAFLELGEGGNPALILGTLINDGVIHDPGEKLANVGSNFTNNSIRIVPLDEPWSSPCSYTYINAFELGNAVSVDLPLDFFSTPDIDFNNWAGVYFEYDNEAYLLDHLPVYYAEFVDSQFGCSHFYSIPRDDCSFSINESSSVAFDTKSTRPKPKGQVTLSPNPTSGHLQIQVPASESETITFRLIDALGRLLWENEMPSAETNTIDLPTSLSDGWYVIHLYDDGELLHSEKLLLNRQL